MSRRDQVFMVGVNLSNVLYALLHITTYIAFNSSLFCRASFGVLHDPIDKNVLSEIWCSICCSISSRG